eukprot:jgi/Mesvir1/13451/Mv16514-RA.1
MNLSATGLAPEVVLQLARHGVHTVEDYILWDTSMLQAPGHESAAAVKEMLDAVSRYLTSNYVLLVPTPLAGASATGGDGALTDAPGGSAACMGHAVSTGCASLDALLRGGLRVGVVTELVGTSAVGKTQVVFSAAASAVTSHDTARVVFVDTCGTFSPQRLSLMCRHMLRARDPQVAAPREALSDALKRVAVLHAFDAPSLLGVVEWLAMKMQEQANPVHLSTLLVIDSASAVLKPVLGVPNAQGLALMNALGHALKFLAKRHRLAVLVTNQMVEKDGRMKPALGATWARGQQHQLQLSKDLASGTCTAEVTRHSLTASALVFLVSMGVSGAACMVPAVVSILRSVDLCRLPALHGRGWTRPKACAQ